MKRSVSMPLALLFTCVLAAGCGLKPNASQLYVGPGGQLGAGTGANSGLGPDGLPADGAAGSTDGTGGLGDGGTGSGPGGTGSGPGGTGGTGGTGPDGDGPPTGPDGPKVGKTIRIGIHAPVTGAAAFPQRSFQSAVGVYAKYINDKGGINGRKLELHFEDDAFNPNTAQNKCKYFAEQLKVFLIIGGAGSDQIDACARYANAVGVPYISAGVHEVRPGKPPLASLRTYYAASLSYEQQAPMVARTAKSKLGSGAVGLLVASNDSMNNYFGVQRGALQKSFGSNLKFADRVPKSIQAEAPTIAAKICNSGVKGVVWNASPSGLINVTKAMTCSVTFFGPGNTNGINIVATGGCPQLEGARFFSTFPQLDVIDKVDPAFRPAYRKKNGSDPDDIGIVIWGIEKLVGQMIAASGKDLTAQKFMATLNSGKTFNAGVFPPTRFAGGKKLGGTGMHLLRADCGARQYRTEARNVRP